MMKARNGMAVRVFSLISGSVPQVRAAGLGVQPYWAAMAPSALEMSASSLANTLAACL